MPARMNCSAGELIYIPGNLIMTSLAYQDSFSYKHEVIANDDELVHEINSNIWHPQSGWVCCSPVHSLWSG